MAALRVGGGINSLSRRSHAVGSQYLQALFKQISPYAPSLSESTDLKDAVYLRNVVERLVDVVVGSIQDKKGAVVGGLARMRCSGCFERLLRENEARIREAVACEHARYRPGALKLLRAMTAAAAAGEFEVHETVSALRAVGDAVVSLVRRGSTAGRPQHTSSAPRSAR